MEGVGLKREVMDEIFRLYIRFTMIGFEKRSNKQDKHKNLPH